MRRTHACVMENRNDEDAYDGGARRTRAYTWSEDEADPDEGFPKFRYALRVSVATIRRHFANRHKMKLFHGSSR